MLTDRCRGASQLLLRHAISAADSGLVRTYFAEQVAWEAPMRQQFEQLARRLQLHEDCQQDALIVLRELNRRYATRAPDLPHVRDGLLAAIAECGSLLAIVRCKNEDKLHQRHDLRR